MDLLLDTHVCLWWAAGPEALAPDALAAIDDPRGSVAVSAASAWELALKVRAGKLTVDVNRLFDELALRGCVILGIGVDDSIRSGALDWVHRDPFDRMLAAQALRTDRVLVTRDRAVQRFLAERSLAA